MTACEIARDREKRRYLVFGSLLKAKNHKNPNQETKKPKEPRAKNQEPGTKNQKPRTKNQEPLQMHPNEEHVLLPHSPEVLRICCQLSMAFSL